MLPMTVSATLCPLCPFFHHPCNVPLLEGTGLLVQHLCKYTNTNHECFPNEPLEMNAVNFASRQTIELRNTMFFSIKENQIYIPVFLLVYIQALSIIPSENRSCLQMQFL